MKLHNRRIQNQRDGAEKIRYHTLTGRKNTPKPEDMYKALIKSGDVQIIRRRGKPPLIKWIRKVA